MDTPQPRLEVEALLVKTDAYCNRWASFVAGTETNDSFRAIRELARAAAAAADLVSARLQDPDPIIRAKTAEAFAYWAVEYGRAIFPTIEEFTQHLGTVQVTADPVWEVVDAWVVAGGLTTKTVVTVAPVIYKEVKPQGTGLRDDLYASHPEASARVLAHLNALAAATGRRL